MNMSNIQTNSSSSSRNANNVKDTDCLECRLVSGFGLIGGGLYVGHHARKQTRVGKLILGTVSAGFIILGSCRLLKLPPFASKSEIKS